MLSHTVSTIIHAILHPTEAINTIHHNIRNRYNKSITIKDMNGNTISGGVKYMRNPNSSFNEVFNNIHNQLKTNENNITPSNNRN